MCNTQWAAQILQNKMCVTKYAALKTQPKKRSTRCLPQTVSHNVCGAKYADKICPRKKCT